MSEDAKAKDKQLPAPAGEWVNEVGHEGHAAPVRYPQEDRYAWCPTCKAWLVIIRPREARSAFMVRVTGVTP